MVPHTTRIEFLGITCDSQSMTMEIPMDKIKDTQAELDQWLYRTAATRKELESIIGRLQFMGKCVKPGRVFVARLLNWLKTLHRKGKHNIPLEARKDFAWWGRFLQNYNGVSIIWLHNNPQPGSIIATDASKKGFGGLADNEYFRGRFPKNWEEKNIAELEIRAVVVALNIWGSTKLKGQYFWVHVDNEAVATVMNTGASRDPALQEALREIALLAAKFQFMIKAKHISGVSNRILDWLSRWHQPESKRMFNQYIKDKGMKRCTLPKQCLQFTHTW